MADVDRPAFHIWRDPAQLFRVWRWRCTLCQPPVEGARTTWHAIVTISLPHHMSRRDQHHAHVHRARLHSHVPEVLAGIDIPAAWPPRTIVPPREVSQVEGCNCGGLTFHRAPDHDDPGCSLWEVVRSDPDAAMAAIDAARARGQAFTDALNDQLRRIQGRNQP